MSHAKGDVGALIRARLTTGQIAIDVGAWGGSETDIMATCVGPTGRVYALDPCDDDRALATVVGTHPHVTWIKAVADRRGGTTQFWPGDKGQSSFYRALVPTPHAAQDVPAVTLDSLHEPTTALVKLDAQGSEMAVLDGALRLLRTCSHWIVECWPLGLHVAGTSAPLLVQRLRDADLTVRWADGDPLTDHGLAAWMTKCGTNGFVNLTADRDA